MNKPKHRQSIDILSLFNQRLHQNAGDYIAVDKRGNRFKKRKKEGWAEKWRDRKEKEKKEKKKKKERKNLSVKRVYVPSLCSGMKY